MFRHTLVDQLLNKADVAMTKLLCPMAENAERRGRLQCMNEGSADEFFVWGQKLELAVHEGEELFFEGRLPQTGILADRSNSLIHLLLKEMQSTVFLGPEIVEDGAFSDAGLARNCFSRGGVKAPGLKERQRGCHNSLPNRRFVLRPPPHRTLRRGPAAPLLFRCRFLLCGHSK